MKLWKIYLRRGWMLSIGLALLCVALELNSSDPKSHTSMIVGIVGIIWSIPGLLAGWEAD